MKRPIMSTARISKSTGFSIRQIITSVLLVLIICVLMIIAWNSGFKNGSLRSLSKDENHRIANNNIPVLIASNPSENIIPENNIEIKYEADLEKLLKANELFESTLRSCLGNYCTDWTFASEKNSKLKRIGVLSPGDFLQYSKIKKILTANTIKDSDIQFTSHVPPYGYGKNHGWSRIIRFFHNVPIHAYQLAIANAGNATLSQLLQVHYPAQLAQIFGPLALQTESCRSTYMHAYKPNYVLQGALSFMNFLVSKENLEKLLALHDIRTIDDGISSKLQLTEESLPKPFWSIAERILVDEMESSEGLTKWPCKNFKDLKKNAPKFNYSHLAANCTAPYVTCSVRFDLAEQSGI